MGLLSSSIERMTEGKDIEGLNRALVDKDPVIRAEAAKALAKLARKRIGRKSSIPALNKCLTDGSPKVRYSAVFALRNLAGLKIGDRSSIPFLNECLSDPNVRIQTAAAYTLGHLAEIRLGDIRSIPYLNECLKNAHENEMANIAYVLGVLAKMKIGKKSSIPVLNDCLNQRNTVMRTNAAYALGYLAEMKIGDLSTVKLLNRCLKSKDVDLRAMAVFVIASLAKLGIGKSTSIPLLNKCLTSKNAKLRQNSLGAIAALAKMKMRYSTSVPYLIRSLKDPEPVIRSWTAFALGNIGDESAVEPLIRMLNDKDPNVRGNVIFALGELRAVLVADRLKPLMNVRTKCEIIDLDVTYKSDIGEEATKAIIKIMNKEINDWLVAINAVEQGAHVPISTTSQLIPIYEQIVRLKTYPSISRVKEKYNTKLNTLAFVEKKYESLAGRSTKVGEDARALLQESQKDKANLVNAIAELDELNAEIDRMIQELEDRVLLLVVNPRFNGGLDSDTIKELLMSTLDKERGIEDRISGLVNSLDVDVERKESDKLGKPDLMIVPARPFTKLTASRKQVKKIKAHEKPRSVLSYYDKRGRTVMKRSKGLEELRRSTGWNKKFWSNGLRSWQDQASKFIIRKIEGLSEQDLNKLIRLVVEDSNTCRDLANLIEKWNSNKYYRWYGGTENILEVKTAYVGGLYGLTQLLLFNEIKMYPENQRYFDPVLKMYNKPENRYYNFPDIKMDPIIVNDEAVTRFFI